MLHLLSLLRPLQSTWGGDRGGGGSDGGGTDGGGADGGSPSHTPQVFVQSCFFLGLYFLHFFSLHFAPFLSVHAGGPGGGLDGDALGEGGGGEGDGDGENGGGEGDGGEGGGEGEGGGGEGGGGEIRVRTPGEATAFQRFTTRKLRLQRCLQRYSATGLQQSRGHIIRAWTDNTTRTVGPAPGWVVAG